MYKENEYRNITDMLALLWVSKCLHKGVRETTERVARQEYQNIIEKRSRWNSVYRFLEVALPWAVVRERSTVGSEKTIVDLLTNK